MGKQTGQGSTGHMVSRLKEAVRRELPAVVLRCLELADADFWAAAEWTELAQWFDAHGHTLSGEAAFTARVLLAQYKCHHTANLDAATHAITVFEAPDAAVHLRLRAARVLVWVSLEATHQPEVQLLLARVRTLCDAHRQLDESVHARSLVMLASLIGQLAAAGVALPGLPAPRSVSRVDVPVLRDFCQSQLDELGDAIRACPSAERSDVAPLLVMAMLLFFSAGRAAADFTLGRARLMFGAEQAESCDTVAALMAYCAGDSQAVLAVLDPAHKFAGPCLTPALLGLRHFLVSRACGALGQHDEALVHLAHYADALHASRRADACTLTLAQAQAQVQTNQLGHGRATLSRQRPAAQSLGQPVCLQRALSDIDAHLHRAVDVARIVSASGVSRRTLETAFRRHLGVSICEAAKAAKLNHANQLLSEHGLGLPEVRARVGYTSASCFSRDFRALFGVAPSTLRSEKQCAS